MKRLFGGQGSTTALSGQPNEAHTPAVEFANSKPRSSNPSEATSIATSTTTHAPHRAPLYTRASHSFSTQAQSPALLTPHTPSASSVNPFELFPPSFPLSPSNSRLSNTSSIQMPLSLPGLTSSSSSAYNGAGSLTAIQNIAPQQLTGQQKASNGINQNVQTGTTPVIADSNASLTNMQAHAIERNDLHKNVKALEGVLVCFDEYRDLKARLAKCEKKLSKGLNEMAKVKCIEEVPSQTLLSASELFDVRMEVSSKQAKLIQKEYDALNDQCAKYFKKIAKEERSHDEQLDSLDSKMKKVQSSYDKSTKKGGKSSIAIESHDKFIVNMQGLTSEVARLKASHSSSVGTKTFSTSLMVAACMGGLADAEYKSVCENVRKSGQYIGKLNEWLNFTVNEAMCKSPPMDLNDDGSGIAQKIVEKEAEIVAEVRRQEYMRLKQLEDEHAMLKLQQLGWTPPTAALESSNESIRTKSPSVKTSKSVTTLANLPKLDSNGNLVDGRGNKTPTPVDIDSATSKAESPKASSPKESLNESKMDSSYNSSQFESHHLQASSIAEGTVIIRDAEPDKREEVDVPKRMQTVKEEPDSPIESEIKDSPSSDESSNLSSGLSSGLGASTSTIATSKGGSEDSNSLVVESRSAGPLTPIDEKSDDVLVCGIDDKNSSQWKSIGKEDIDTKGGRIKEMNDSINRAISPSNAQPYYMGITSQMGNPVAELNNKSPRPREAQKTPIRSDQRIDEQDEEQRTRSSVWERERERERQMELERRLAEAENRLRMMDQPGNYTSTQNRYGYGGNAQDQQQQPQYMRENEPIRNAARPRFSEPVQKSSTSFHPDEEIPASRYEPDHYAPAVGSSRIEGPSVSRSLSTDSERSFVARMKALYQADRMQTTSTQDRRKDLHNIPASPHRVPEIAQNYSSMSSNRSDGGMQTKSSSQHIYESSTMPSKSRSRYDSAPTQYRAGGSSDRQRVDEYGRPENTESSTSGRRSVASNEPPHASSCGCWNCSARHYRTSDSTSTNGASISMATTKAGILPPQPPPRHPEALHQKNGYQQNLPPNYRRQTMQVPPSNLPSNYPSSNGRTVSNSGRGLMKPEQELQTRRSFGDETPRRVDFVREHGTVR